MVGSHMEEFVEKGRSQTLALLTCGSGVTCRQSGVTFCRAYLKWSGEAVGYREMFLEAAVLFCLAWAVVDDDDEEEQWWKVSTSCFSGTVFVPEEEMINCTVLVKEIDLAVDMLPSMQGLWRCRKQNFVDADRFRLETILPWTSRLNFNISTLSPKHTFLAHLTMFQ